MNPKAIGEISEAMVLAALVKQGAVVLLPIGNNQRYDLVVDLGDGQFERAQVKTAYQLPGGIGFKTNNVNAFTGVRTSYVGQVDVFMAYSPHTGKVYRVPIGECGNSQVKLRIEPTPSGQKYSTIRWARDYEIDRVEVSSMPQSGVAQLGSVLGS